MTTTFKKSTEIFFNTFSFLTKVSVFRCFWCFRCFSKGTVEQISNSVSVIFFAFTSGPGSYHNSVKL